MDITLPTSPGDANLLGLPVELRLQIWHALFNDREYQELKPFRSISLTCHQIRSETLPFLLVRNHSSYDMNYFLDWIADGSPHLLSHIKELSCSWVQPQSDVTGETRLGVSTGQQEPALNSVDDQIVPIRQAFRLCQISSISAFGSLDPPSARNMRTKRCFFA